MTEKQCKERFHRNWEPFGPFPPFHGGIVTGDFPCDNLPLLIGHRESAILKEHLDQMTPDLNVINQSGRMPQFNVQINMSGNASWLYRKTEPYIGSLP